MQEKLKSIYASQFLIVDEGLKAIDAYRNMPANIKYFEIARDALYKLASDQLVDDLRRREKKQSYNCWSIIQKFDRVFW